MKRILTSLMALLLVCSTLFLCACGEPETPPTPTPSDPTNPGGNAVDVYDPSNPMSDPSTGVLSVLYNRAGLLAQPEESLFPNSSLEHTKMLGDFVNAATIINRGRPEVPLYGLYAFTHEYQQCQDDITAVGFTNIRASREQTYVPAKDHNVTLMTDADMRLFCENNISVMFTVGAGPINSASPDRSCFFPQKNGVSYPTYTDLYDDLENYDFSTTFRRSILYTLDLLGKYGPRGTFFDENPDVNYNPIRYIEIFNEPNYQYLIPVTRVGGSDDPYRDIKYKVYALIHTATALAVREVYGNEVQIVGLSVGGGADDVGKHFVEEVLKLSGNEELTKILNDAINPDALVQYSKDLTVTYKTADGNVDSTQTKYVAAENNKESDADFAKRKQYAQEVRDLLGLEDGETIELDLISTMDIISIHPYIDGQSPFACNGNTRSQSDVIKSMRTSIEKYASEEDKERAKTIPIWFTECGWQIKGRKAYAVAYPEDVANGILGGTGAEYSNASTGTSQIIQAAMEVQDYLYGIRNGIDRITYMHLYDSDGCNYGLVNFGYGGKNNGTGGGDRTWRLTLHAIKNMIDILPNPALKNVVREDIKTINGKAVGTYIYEIEADVGGEIVTTVLSPLTAQNGLLVDWDEDYALVTDMFGKSQIVKAVNGQISVDAGPYLTYVRHVSREMLIAHGLIAPLTAATIVEMFGNAWNANEETI